LHTNTFFTLPNILLFSKKNAGLPQIGMGARRGGNEGEAASPDGEASGRCGG